jgi:hypothetical protein
MVKKHKIKPAEGGKDRPSVALRKQAGPRPPQRPGDTLTCNEAQVEDLLSEGEST